MKTIKIVLFVLALVAFYLIMPVTYEKIFVCKDPRGLCIDLYSSSETVPTYEFFIGLLTDSKNTRFIDSSTSDIGTSQKLVTNAISELIAGATVIFVAIKLKKKNNQIRKIN